MSSNSYFRPPFFARRTDQMETEQNSVQPELPLSRPDQHGPAAHAPSDRPHTRALANPEPVRRSGPVTGPSAIPALLSGKALAQRLGISHRTLERMRVEGGRDALPYHKLGGGKRAAVRYNEAEVLAWLDRHRRTSTSEGGG